MVESLRRRDGARRPDEPQQITPQGEGAEDEAMPEAAACPLDTLGATAAARGAMTRLSELGLAIDAFGLPATAASSRPYDPATPGPHALRHRQRQWTPVLAAAAIRAPLLAPMADAINEHGGEENGLWLTANAGPDVEPLDDHEWIIDTRLRLGLTVGHPCLCQHRRTTATGAHDGKRCLAPLDALGRHARTCMTGGARTTLHNTLCRLVHQACCAAGLRSQREVVVPALATAKLTEPRIDVDAWGHPGLPHLRLDVTVADPDAVRNAGGTDRAERSKATKYGVPRGGVGVTGLALALTGRLGTQFDGLLRHLAGLARAGRAALGQESTRHLRHWHTQISIALARFNAAAVSAAFVDTPHGLASTRPASEPLHSTAPATNAPLAEATAAAMARPTPVGPATATSAARPTPAEARSARPESAAGDAPAVQFPPPTLTHPTVGCLHT